MNNKFFPSNFLFIMIMFTGTMFSLSSSHWLTMWMGLELNLMGFLPLMNIKGKMLEAEASMKYFIIQSMSSSILIISSVIMYNNNLSWYSMFSNNTIGIMIMLSLILKLGGAPLHFWLPSITKQMSWMILFLMLTWQKLAPLLMLSLMNSNLLILIMISIMSTIMGSIMALNQTNIQLIMTYSSISHLGWMLSMISINSSLTLIYFINYIMISMPLMSLLSTSLGNHLFMLTHKNKTNNMITISLILSLGGLPPLLGFMSKLIILISLIEMKMLMLTLFLFTGTLISLYFYLNMSLMLMIKSYMTLKTQKINKMYNPVISLNMLSSFIMYPLIMMFIKYAMTIFYK
uniref:NADH-ubiquinone oxidoreductase chain 2 n=2 Tax=Architeuthis dux TaxID=256136 RepID=B6ED03_ARCDU|nr:NADH dehydrogenase subunit 2 [Architeuthis dux]ACI46966.1 NADH dehydrogenase subunit 2 [Architeuthis dux]ACJ11907.1 NADH dehydrogenase subunit 2 [Architeuthis dux]AEB52407.1 NADH dehydrogenase subunit 2 [Architeuthis dux]AGK37142.1 NADH dehydrogenase subunit 2 [Architeuthis dux]AGK37160.1 NADH dehydrogenase subunit 2 [Architeuthis dux]